MRGLITCGVSVVGRWPVVSQNAGRRPCSAIVTAIDVICSVVARTRPWPIAEEPSARSSPIAVAEGIVLVAAPGTGARLSKPKRSAAATSPGAPTLTPSGAKTELQEVANAWARVPPHDSPLALDNSTPESLTLVAKS